MVELALKGFLPIIGMILSFAMVITIIIIVSRARERRLQIQAELQAKLIEKFGTTTELVTFLQSPVGRQFVNGVQSGNARLIQERVLSGYRRAIILSFIGVAFLVLWLITDLIGLAWPGVLLLALGLAYLVATMTTARLAAGVDLTPAVPEPPAAPPQA